GTAMSLSRRDFASATVLGLAGLGRAPWVARRRDHDIVIRGGTVIDGSGAAAIRADVAITGDRIVAVAPVIAERGTREVDARDRVVAPGFIDIHSHADGSLEEDPRLESVVRQGITTAVVGADGGSRSDLAEFFARVDALGPGA